MLVIFEYVCVFGYTRNPQKLAMPLLVEVELSFCFKVCETLLKQQFI